MLRPETGTSLSSNIANEGERYDSTVVVVVVEVVVVMWNKPCRLRPRLKRFVFSFVSICFCLLCYVYMLSISYPDRC